MKVLKIVGIVIVGFVLLALIGAFIFLKTLNVNQYIPLITQQVKQSVGRDLKVGHADLRVSLLHGISLEVSGIALSDDPGFSKQLFLSVDKAYLGLSLKPLILERKIQIADVTVISPKVVIIRNREGQINVATMVAAPAGSDGVKKDSVSGKTAALPALLIDRVKFVNASVTYVDEMFSPRIALTVDQLDFLLRDFSLAETFSFELKANIFSQEKDLELSGKARLALATASIGVTDLKLTLDLDKISTVKLNEMVPMVLPAGLKDPLRGKFVIVVPELKAGANGLQALKFNGTLTGGQVVSSLLPMPLLDISLVVDGDVKDVSMKSCDFRVAGGTVNVTGIVHGYMSAPVIEMIAKVNEVELGKISEAYNLPIKATGKTKADVKLSMSGKAPQEITSSLKAEITGSLKDGALEGINLVQTGLGNIPMLPTLWEMVQPSLPAETQEDLKKGRTLIESAAVLLHMNGMTATVDKAEIVTRDVVASAKGTVQIPEAVNLNIDIYLQKAIATVLVQKVSDLAGIRDDQGKLYIPLKLVGPMLKPKVEPDVQYLSKKLILNRGKEALQKVIDKNPQVQGVLNAIFGTTQSDSKSQDGTAQPANQGSNPSGQDTQPGTSQTVETIFNSLFKKK